MRRQSKFLLAVIVGFPALWASGTACQPKDLILLTGPETGYYYQFGKAIEQVALTKGIRICAMPVEKTLENIVNLTNGSSINNLGPATFAIVQSDVVHDAWHGHGGKFPERLDKVKLVMPLYVEAVHILIRPHLYISGLSGLRDKRVWMGPDDSATKYTVKRVLTAAGVDVQDGAKPGGDRTGKISNFCDAVRRLGTMELDAVFRVTRAPSPDVQDVLATEPENGKEARNGCVGASEIELLALDYEVVQRLVRDGSYAETLIPRSAYGQSSSTLTIGVQALLVTNKANDDGDVSKLANLLRTERNTIQQAMAESVQHEHQHQHENFVPQLSLMDVDTNAGLRRFMHPLAERYLYQWWRDSWQPLLRFLIGFIIIIALLVWRRHPVRKTVRRQPRIAFAAVGMLLIWCLGSGILVYFEGNVNECFNSFPRSLESMILYSTSFPGYEMVTRQGHLAGQIAKWLSVVLLGGLVTPLAKEALERMGVQVLQWLERENPVSSQLAEHEEINREKAVVAGDD